MARNWWNDVGGSLCWLYPLIRQQRGVQQQRIVDAIIRPHRTGTWMNGSKGRWRAFGSLQDSDVTVLQVEQSLLLDKPLLGQTVVSGLSAQRAGASSVKTVALCTETDAELEEIARELASSQACSSLLRLGMPLERHRLSVDARMAHRRTGVPR
jgi:hypothetical protein